VKDAEFKRLKNGNRRLGLQQINYFLKETILGKEAREQLYHE
jgi:hypothetical protein